MGKMETLEFGISSNESRHGCPKPTRIGQKRLAEFGLDLKEDAICIVTDGDSVMKKIGKFPLHSSNSV